ncbi:MAG: DUF427 domain-containing protein [Thermomicrobiales bacterium]
MTSTTIARREDDRFFRMPNPFVEPSPRRVRVKFGGAIIADSKHPLLLSQYGPGQLPGYLPSYYFPPEDVRMDALTSSAPSDLDGSVAYQTIRIADHVADRAAWIVQRPPAELTLLHTYISFTWERMDAWYEEEEEVFVHARDLHKRVDVLASARHVQVMIAGEMIAETRRPYLLFETHLPTRYYIPRENVRTDLLTPTTHTSRCPYKGIAQYWSVTLGGRTLDNIVWSYPEPIPENPKIKDLLCFFNERVDLCIDGEVQQRPLTPWSTDAPEGRL